jgi:hypothetical protein
MADPPVFRDANFAFESGEPSVSAEQVVGDVVQVSVHGGLGTVRVAVAQRVADITVLQDHDRLHCIMKDGQFHEDAA